MSTPEQPDTGLDLGKAQYGDSADDVDAGAVPNGSSLASRVKPYGAAVKTGLMGGTNDKGQQKEGLLSSSEQEPVTSFKPQAAGNPLDSNPDPGTQPMQNTAPAAAPHAPSVAPGDTIAAQAMNQAARGYRPQLTGNGTGTGQQVAGPMSVRSANGIGSRDLGSQPTPSPLVQQSHAGQTMQAALVAAGDDDPDEHGGQQ